MDAELQLRLVELETRVAFQDQALLDLSDALAASRHEVAQIAECLQRVMERQSQSGDELIATPSEEPPPPHY